MRIAPRLRNARRFCVMLDSGDERVGRCNAEQAEFAENLNAEIAEIAEDFQIERCQRPPHQYRWAPRSAAWTERTRDSRALVKCVECARDRVSTRSMSPAYRPASPPLSHGVELLLIF